MNKKAKKKKVLRGDDLYLYDSNNYENFKLI